MTTMLASPGWAKKMDGIEAECDNLETWGIEVVRLAELLELVADRATQFPEMLTSADKNQWEHVYYLIGLLRRAGEQIEATSAETMREAAALAELARKGSAA
jgi:hypothetical protein